MINKNRGFTLIELMVATTLFTIIMMMGVGSLVVASNASKAAQKLRVAVDNVNFAMESMTREIRMGSYYDCKVAVDMSNILETQDCPSGGDFIVFTPQKVNNIQVDKRIAYKMTTDGSNRIERCVNNSNNCSSIISPSVSVNTFRFYVNGSGITDKVQPSVKIIIKGVVNVGGVGTPFAVQTMASQRSSE